MKKFIAILFVAVCLLVGPVFADVSITSQPDFNWQLATSGGVPSLSSLNWGGPVKPLAPIKVFGKQVAKFQIGKYGQLKFLTYPDGRFNYSDKEFELPESIDKLREGYQIIGFGEPLKIKGCGTNVSHGLAGSNYVITFSAIHLYTGDRQRWQYVFPLKEHNKIIVNYRSVVTGVNTIIGAVGKSGTGDQWVPLENHDYKNKAVEIDTNADAGEELPPDDVVIDEPPVDPDPDIDPVVDWKTSYSWHNAGDNYEYRLQQRWVK